MNESRSNFKTADAASYDELVGDFQRFTALLTTPLAKRVVIMAGISPGDRVLDIGAGTGVVALEAAKQAGPNGSCVGIDLSEKMLAMARQNAHAAGVSGRLQFQVMDAEAISFAKSEFDVVVSLFALLHFPNPLAALREMFRVLKPNGTLVIAIGSTPRWLSWRGLRHAATLAPDAIAQARGRLLIAPHFLNRLVENSIPPPEEPEESALAESSRDRTRRVPDLVREAGFEITREHWEGHQASLKTPEDFWDIQRTFSSIARKRLNHASAEEAAAVRAKFDAHCSAVLARGGRLLYPFAAWFVAARKPPE